MLYEALGLPQFPGFPGSRVPEFPTSQFLIPISPPLACRSPVSLWEVLASAYLILSISCAFSGKQWIHLTRPRIRAGDPPPFPLQHLRSLAISPIPIPNAPVGAGQFLELLEVLEVVADSKEKEKEKDKDKDEARSSTTRPPADKSPVHRRSHRRAQQATSSLYHQTRLPQPRLSNPSRRISAAILMVLDRNPLPSHQFPPGVNLSAKPKHHPTAKPAVYNKHKPSYIIHQFPHSAGLSSGTY